MNEFNPQMIKLGRQLAELTQSELAARVGVSRSCFAFLESGQRSIRDDHALAIARELGRPVSFLSWKGELCAPSTVFHRRKASTRMQVVERTNAFINLVRLKVLRIISGMKLRSRRQLYRLEFSNDRDPADAARRLRAAWQVSPGPIPNLIELLESAGIVVWKSNQLPSDVDGLSLWPLGSEHETPLIVISEQKSTDRIRFSLSHEVGHMALHHMPCEDYEAEANEFAAEFLMPSDDVAPDLRNMTLPKAAALKHKWLVSMQAIIRRSFDLQCISNAHYRRLQIELGKKGYRTHEPAPIPPEHPRLLPYLMSELDKRIGSAKVRQEFLGELPDRPDEPLVPTLKVFAQES